MAVRLSILDQSPIDKGDTGSEALRSTVRLAQQAEQLGYHRFWVSEHHDSTHVAGSSPEVLISYLLASTERIRVGSGGVMLQHYSPYKVAENFNVLSSLAPGRVDLGIGRSPGGLPKSAQALRQSNDGSLPDLTEKLEELDRFLTDSLEESHPLHGLKATPIPLVPADLFILGTSVESARQAARLGLPYVFSLFITGDEDAAEEALNAYRDAFISVRGSEPLPLVALSVIAADTEEEAAAIASDVQLIKIHLESGRTITVATLEHAEQFEKQSTEPYTIEVKQPHLTKGTGESVWRELKRKAERLNVSELILLAPIRHPEKRIRAFELLSEAAQLVYVEQEGDRAIS
ncbi:LLM class flavin-dependent oxidoreductase [Paenibacillus paeoniae]|uniref:LLM class flavin-dependent oxidoreductase n=1 Tax=Paenibacillus paeoniae TaxID=2292705 RepID=A0A371PIT7_9BACL|nr:LLM class flavin-dependent oxidoreductase [Paenibacillus paeoniae]REK76054.1 LLM class flavin-dependent oxidoreductase [Paenibacillus paeoniae]